MLPGILGVQRGLRGHSKGVGMGYKPSGDIYCLPLNQTEIYFCLFYLEDWTEAFGS